MEKITTSEFRRRFCSGYHFAVSNDCKTGQHLIENVHEKKEYDGIIVSLNPDVIIFTSSETAERLSIGIISCISMSMNTDGESERYLIEYCTGDLVERALVDVYSVK